MRLYMYAPAISIFLIAAAPPAQNARLVNQAAERLTSWAVAKEQSDLSICFDTNMTYHRLWRGFRGFCKLSVT